MELGKAKSFIDVVDGMTGTMMIGRVNERGQVVLHFKDRSTEDEVVIDRRPTKLLAASAIMHDWRRKPVADIAPFEEDSFGGAYSCWYRGRPGDIFIGRRFMFDIGDNGYTVAVDEWQMLDLEEALSKLPE